MCPDHDGNIVLFFNEFFKLYNMWAWRITDDKSGSQMNRFCAIFNHLDRCIFYVSAGTSAARGVAHHFKRFTLIINIKGTLAVPHCSQAFPAGTGAESVTNKYTDFHFFSSFIHLNHCSIYYTVICSIKLIKDLSQSYFFSGHVETTSLISSILSVQTPIPKRLRQQFPGITSNLLSFSYHFLLSEL